MQKTRLVEGQSLISANITPELDSITKIVSSYKAYEPHKKDADWCKKNFMSTPWGIAWNVGPRGRKSSKEKAMCYFFIALLIHWDELVAQLKRTLHDSYQFSKADIQEQFEEAIEPYLAKIINAINHVASSSPASSAKVQDSLAVTNAKYALNETAIQEDIEKHNELNPKLWNSDNTLKPEVAEKIEQIVDEFIANLQEDDIDIKVDDIIILGSNCSYNYTKDSDLDIHIIADAAQSKYPSEAASKLYSAYRTIFNKNLDIDFYGIPVEIYVEDENSSRISNGIYSVMNHAWIKEPVAEDIPEIDKEAFDKEFQVWEDKYNDIVAKVGTKLDEAFIGTIEDVIELPDFEDARREFGLSDNDIEIAKNEIKQNPNIGDVIQGCGGARKLRIAITANNKGKSGGARAAYLNYYPDQIAYLISIIIKSEQSDFTAAQKKQIAKAVNLIKQ